MEIMTVLGEMHAFQDYFHGRVAIQDRMSEHYVTLKIISLWEKKHFFEWIFKGVKWK